MGVKRSAIDLVVFDMAGTTVRDDGRVANVGDRVLDLRVGHNAGVRFSIGVVPGAHGRDVLAAEPHTHLLASAADLPALLEDA